jgi:hypothetical protein
MEPAEYTYRGTSALQATGSASATLASNSVVLHVCAGDPQTDPPTPTFTVLTVGESCTLAGWGGVETFSPPVGSPCSLAFADGTRALRVTDVVARYGERGRFYDTTYIDLALGADDAKSGDHALYHFTGRLVGKSEPAEAMRCTEVRKKMQGEASSAG